MTHYRAAAVAGLAVTVLALSACTGDAKDQPAAQPSAGIPVHEVRLGSGVTLKLSVTSDVPSSGKDVGSPGAQPSGQGAGDRCWSLAWLSEAGAVTGNVSACGTSREPSAAKVFGAVVGVFPCPDAGTVRVHTAGLPTDEAFPVKHDFFLISPDSALSTASTLLVACVPPSGEMSDQRAVTVTG